ncbi:MAG TPA: hypothetical protein VF756_30545 [Thermoanaerobaculia bacterium]
MRRWWLAIALLLSVGVNLGILAVLLTHRGGPRPERPVLDEPEPGRPSDRPFPRDLDPGEPPSRVVRLADRLGLEGEQRRRFISLQRRFFMETLRLRTERAEIQRELRRELTSPEPDRERVQTLLRESARTFLALEQALARNVIASRELLDPEQEELYLDIVSRLRPPGLGGQPPRNQRRPPRWRER